MNSNNAPHYRDLLNFPHHIHYADDKIETIESIPNILKIISEIEHEIK